MAKRSELDLARLHLDDDDSDVGGLFDSPVRRSTTPKEPVPTGLQNEVAKHNRGVSNVSAAVQTANNAVPREKALEAELAQLQEMNSSLSNLNQSLTIAKSNLQTMQTNMNSAKTLLKTWSRILSQAEHNQRLILDSRWQGATKDLEDIANEDLQRQADAQRQIIEENARREAAHRKQEEESRRRELDDQKKTRGVGRSRSVRGGGLGSGSTARSQTVTPSVRGRGNIVRGVNSGIARGSTRGRVKG